MEWRDVAMALLGLVSYLLKAELGRKAEASTLAATGRRVDDHPANISELFSKVNNEKEDRLNAHITILETQNRNQSALLGTLSAIAGRAANHVDGQ